MKTHTKYLDNSLINKYNLSTLIGPDNYVYCRINKCMYMPKQPACLVYEDLVSHLDKYGFAPDKICLNIWTFKKRKTKFCSCVDDFGIKYFNNADKNHLIGALQDKYEITTDMTDSNFYSLTLNWNYVHGYMIISMTNFVDRTLKN